MEWPDWPIAACFLQPPIHSLLQNCTLSPFHLNPCDRKSNNNYNMILMTNSVSSDRAQWPTQQRKNELIVSAKKGKEIDVLYMQKDFSGGGRLAHDCALPWLHTARQMARTVHWLFPALFSYRIKCIYIDYFWIVGRPAQQISNSGMAESVHILKNTYWWT